MAGFDAIGSLSIDRLVTAGELEELRAELRRLSEDPVVRADERTIVEASSQEVRSVFDIHQSRLISSTTAAGTFGFRPPRCWGEGD